MYQKCINSHKSLIDKVISWPKLEVHFGEKRVNTQLNGEGQSMNGVEIDEMEPKLKRTVERCGCTSTVDGVVFNFMSATCAHVSPSLSFFLI